MTLRDLLRTSTRPDGSSAWDCPPGYRQGRGAWGGLVVGAFLDAAITHAADPALVPRSLTAHLLGPVAHGPARIDLTVLRRGSTTLTVSALLTAREGDSDGLPTGDPVVVADAVMVFGADRAADLDFEQSRWNHVDPPAALAAGWQSLEPVAIPAGLAPEFIDRLVLRPVMGFPYTDGRDTETVGWLCPAEPLVPDAVTLAALADAWWLATMPALAAPRPAATLAFSLDLIDLPRTDEPILHRGRILAGRSGYVTESRELWSADGRLLAHNQQTVVIIR